MHRSPLLALLLAPVLGIAGCDTTAGGPSEPREDTSDTTTTDAGPEPDAPPVSPWALPVPLSIVGGLPVFMGSVDGGPEMPFLFDTLAQIVFLDEDIVGDVLYHEADLLLGDDPVGTLQVKGRSMLPDEVYLGMDLAGLVGQAYLWERFLVLDYPGGLLYQLPEPVDVAASPPPGCEGLPHWTVDVQLQNAFPVVRPVLGDAGVPLLADTSSPMTTLTRSTFDALDDGTLPRVAGYLWTSKYGAEDAFLTRIPSLRFGALTVTDLEAVVIPDDHHLVTILGPSGVDVVGWLGAGFWERFALGIDPGEGTEESPQVYHLWGDGADPAHFAGHWDKVGVELAWRDDAVVVEMVYLGTDAATRGVLVGDGLTAIDGAATAGMPLEDVRALLRGAPGDTVVLTLLHADGATEDLAVLIEEILP